MAVSTEQVSPVARRPASIRFAFGLVLMCGAVGALLPLGVAWMTLTGRYLWTGGSADPRKPVEELPQLLQADVREGQSMFLEDLPAWLRALCATPSVVYAITLVVAAVLVARILRVIASGDVFGANVRRTLTALSVTLVGGGLLSGLLDSAAVAAVTGLTFDSHEGESVFRPISALGIDLPSWPAMLIVLGVVAATLRLAFREGSRLREELAGVV